MWRYIPMLHCVFATLLSSYCMSQFNLFIIIIWLFGWKKRDDSEEDNWNLYRECACDVLTLHSELHHQAHRSWEKLGQQWLSFIHDHYEAGTNIYVHSIYSDVVCVRTVERKQCFSSNKRLTTHRYTHVIYICWWFLEKKNWNQQVIDSDSSLSWQFILNLSNSTWERKYHHQAQLLF